MIVGGVHKTWASDLVDMSAFSRDNKGYKFLLGVSDIFSKFGWLLPLNAKRATLRDALQELFNSPCPKNYRLTKAPSSITEEIKELLLKHGELYSIESEEKSNSVEL